MNVCPVIYRKHTGRIMHSSALFTFMFAVRMVPTTLASPLETPDERQNDVPACVNGGLPGGTYLTAEECEHERFGREQDRNDGNYKGICHGSCGSVKVPIGSGTLRPDADSLCGNGSVYVTGRDEDLVT